MWGQPLRSCTGASRSTRTPAGRCTGGDKRHQTVFSKGTVMAMNMKQHRLGWIGIGAWVREAVASRDSRRGHFGLEPHALKRAARGRARRVVNALTISRDCDIVFTMVSTGGREGGAVRGQRRHVARESAENQSWTARRSRSRNGGDREKLKQKSVKFLAARLGQTPR